MPECGAKPLRDVARHGEKSGLRINDSDDAGTYEITAWHERLGTQTASVTVSGSDTKTQAFKFVLPAAK
jgi:hypothetical protein